MNRQEFDNFKSACEREFSRYRTNKMFVVTRLTYDFIYHAIENHYTPQYAVALLRGEQMLKKLGQPVWFAKTYREGDIKYGEVAFGVIHDRLIYVFPKPHYDIITGVRPDKQSATSCIVPEENVFAINEYDKCCDYVKTHCDAYTLNEDVYL